MVEAMKCFLGLWLAVLLTGCVSPRAEKNSPCCRGSAAAALPGEATTGSVYELGTRWEDDAGRKLSLSELRGRPVVISMFYAACQGVCVVTRDDLRAIEASLPAALRSEVRFVLVTLDARHDTVSALRAYRSQEELPHERWRLLRGDADSTTKLARLLGIGFGRDALGRFVHASRIVILDASGKIIHRQDGIHADLVAAGKVLQDAIIQNPAQTGMATQASAQVTAAVADSSDNRGEAIPPNQ